MDTGPVVERVAAKYAGLGWLAKNTCLINEELGSWLFLGVIITTLELRRRSQRASRPRPICAGTARCAWTLAPRRRLPRRTCWMRGGAFRISRLSCAGRFRKSCGAAMGNAVIGCDICQDVCPWNRKSPVTQTRGFQPRRALNREKRENGKEKMENGGNVVCAGTGMAGRRFPRKNSAGFFAAAPSSARNGAGWCATLASRWEIRGCAQDSGYARAHNRLARTSCRIARRNHRGTRAVGVGQVARRMICQLARIDLLRVRFR